MERGGVLTWGAVSRFKAPSRSWVVRWRWERRNHQRSLTWWPPGPFCGGGPGGGGSAAVEPPATHRQPTGKPPANHRETAGRPLAKTAGKPPKTAGKSPVFGSLLPVSIRDRNGRKGPLRRHFSALGGVAIRNALFRLNSCTFRIDGVGGTGICGFLDVTKGILGPMTPKAGFHE